MMRDPLQGTGAPGPGAESRRYDMLGGPVQNRPYDQVRQQRRRLGARVGKCRTTARWSWLRAQCAHARERERARIKFSFSCPFRVQNRSKCGWQAAGVYRQGF
jgi:hypothetical protein